MEAVGAPVRVVHGYALGAQEARGFAKSLLRLPAEKLAATPGVPERRARTLPAAAFMLDRVLKRLSPERVVFSALGLREGLLYSQLEPGRALSRSARRGRSTRRAAAGARAGFRAGAGPVDRRAVSPRGAGQTRLRVAVCALSDIAWRDHPDLRAEESFRRLLQFPFIGVDHAERVFIAAAIHARYVGRPDAPWLSPAIGLLSPALAPARADPRPRDSARLSLFRRRAGDAGRRASQRRGRLRRPRSRRRRKRPRQRSRRRPLEAARGRARGETQRDRRGRGGVAAAFLAPPRRCAGRGEAPPPISPL